MPMPVPLSERSAGVLTGTVQSVQIGCVKPLGAEAVPSGFVKRPVEGDVAVAVNSTVENIGARRLQTVMERVLDEVSFQAPDLGGQTVTIDADYVQKHIGDLAKNADLSRFIL